MNLAALVPAGVAFVLSCFAATAEAQIPVRMLAGFPAGGALDSSARIFSEKLAEGIGRPVIVENRAGAAGQVAIRALKASPPDGNTLSVIPDSVLTLYPHTVKTPPYDALRDFVPVAQVGSYEWGLGIGAAVPAKDFREWLNWVKSDNKNAAYGSAGAGSGPHFLGLILAQATGVPLVHVPFRGEAPAFSDLMAGQVPAALVTFGALARQAKSGKIRILAHTGGRRSSIAPEVPTFKELGYPTLEATGWFSIIAPAGIRPELVARYNEIINQAHRVPAVRARMRALDLELREMSPAEIAAMIKVQYDRWGPAVKASGFSADSQ